MSALSFCQNSTRRSDNDIRKAAPLGKLYHDAAYAPQFALGILCRDEDEQMAIYDVLVKVIPEKDLKVLVI